jgi:hypothetical protein
MVAAGQLGLTGGAQPIFVFFSQIHEKQVYNYFWKPNSTKNMLKLLHYTMEFPLYFFIVLVLVFGSSFIKGLNFFFFFCPVGILLFIFVLQFF